jgi:hypothetical protein
MWKTGNQIAPIHRPSFYWGQHPELTADDAWME